VQSVAAMTDMLATADEQLYSAWASGDRRAGTALVERWLRPIGRFFASKLVDDAEVEDAASRVFEILAKNLGAFRGEGSFRAYLFGIAYNVLREQWRARRHEPIDFEASALRDLAASPPSVVAARDEQRLVLEALRAIPLEYQTVLELSYFEALSRTEIAAALGMPAGTVASRLRRAHELLDARIGELAATPDLARTTRSDLAKWAAELRGRLDRDG